MNEMPKTQTSDEMIRPKNGTPSNGRTPLRLFTCATCGHKLRFGASRCGQCWQPSPLYNQTRFYITLAGAVVVGSLYLYLNFEADVPR